MWELQGQITLDYTENGGDRTLRLTPWVLRKLELQFCNILVKESMTCVHALHKPLNVNLLSYTHNLLIMIRLRVMTTYYKVLDRVSVTSTRCRHAVFVIHIHLS